MPALSHAEILTRAEMLLNARGWCKNGWSDADSGALCIIAAFCEVIDPDADFEDPDDLVPRGVMDAFFFALPGQYRDADGQTSRKGAVYDFNDCEQTNKTDLRATFRDAIARAGEVILSVSGYGVLHVDRGFCHPDRLPVIAMSETSCMTDEEFIDRFKAEFHQDDEILFCMPVRIAALEDGDRIAALNGFRRLLRERHAEVMRPHPVNPDRLYKWSTRLH